MDCWTSCVQVYVLLQSTHRPVHTGHVGGHIHHLNAFWPHTVCQSDNYNHWESPCSIITQLSDNSVFRQSKQREVRAPVTRWILFLDHSQWRISHKEVSSSTMLLILLSNRPNPKEMKNTYRSYFNVQHISLR